MQISSQLGLWLLLCLPKTWALLGSPPGNLPSCLNGGTQSVIQDRYNCNCTDVGMNRQCKLTQVTLSRPPIETALPGPFAITLSTTRSFHLSVQFITDDTAGSGTMLIVKNANGQREIRIFLLSGRPGVQLMLDQVAVTMQFDTTLPVMNDNFWHALDLFIEAEITNQIDVYLMIDWCRDRALSNCMLKQSIATTNTTLVFGGTVQLGTNNDPGDATFDGCLDNVMMENEVLDFDSATRGQPSKRGCSRASLGCTQNGQAVCGTFGVCRNTLRQTDMVTCICQPGFRPNTTYGTGPHRWPCEQTSSAWSTTSTVYNAKFLSKIPARLRISLRTRSSDFRLLSVPLWGLHLTVANGTPTLQFGTSNITLPNVNVSDGNWHLYLITFTSSFLRLQIDQLDGDFYEAIRIPSTALTPGQADMAIAQDALGACLDDAWVDFSNVWNDFEFDYPLEVIPNPPSIREVDWSVQGRQQSCSVGSSQCTATTCDSSAVCQEEWQGFRCECPVNMTTDSSGICQPSQCVPNPCGEGSCNASIVPPNNNRNFTCTCPQQWTGDFCEQAVDVAQAGLSWWWILIIVLLILLFILIVLLVYFCCCRRRRRKGAKEMSEISDPKTMLENEQLGVDSQFNDPWDTGEKDFVGPIDYEVLRRDMPRQQQQQRTPSVYSPNGHRNGMVFANEKPIGSPEPTPINPRDHGQKTSDIPPWEKFEGQENPAMIMDQALEYGYEGLDGKPPPEFRAEEPSSLASVEDSHDFLDQQPDSSPPSIISPIPRNETTI